MLEEFRGTLNYVIALKMQEALREAFWGRSYGCGAFADCDGEKRYQPLFA